MPKYALYLITYDRGKYSTTGKVKPYHWLYFIQTGLIGGQTEGITHQLRGMPGNFYYPGPEPGDIARSGRVKQELEVGEVDVSKLDRVHEILKDVRIETVEDLSWNCQSWSLDAFDKLKEEGFVYDYLTQDSVKNWLREE